MRTEAQATAMALALGAAVGGLHAGPSDEAVADHLGHGLSTLALAPEGRVSLTAEGDPVPALAAALAASPVDLVLAGRCGHGGDDTGLVPYRLAAALGLPIVADAVALAPGPDIGTLRVEQALPRGARRRVVVRLPAVVTVHPAAPPPRPFAYGPARRGMVVTVPAGTDAGATPARVAAAPPMVVEERPWRRRPRLIAGAMTSGSAEDRLKAATEVAGGGGRLLVDPDPAEAAREILAHLRAIGVLAF